jgi:hypothetical protein
VDGIPCEAGREVRISGWPNPAEVEPFSEAATRVMPYFRKYCLGNIFALSRFTTRFAQVIARRYAEALHD